MKYLKTLLVLAISIVAFITNSNAQVNPSQTYVQGYTKADGTYVQGYYKTTPNTTNRDNFTTKPNVNPYTGTPGTITPDNKPAPATTTTYPTTTYSTPTYTAPAATRTIFTGPNGGQYYINSNGNKTYVKP